MATVIEQRIHLLLVANLAQPLFFIRDLESHHAFAVAFPFLEAAGVDIPRLGIGHFALAFGLVIRPVAGVGIAVRVAHGPVAGFEAGGEVARVAVAGEGDGCADTVWATVGDRAGVVRGAEVRGCKGGFKIGRVGGAEQVVSIFRHGGWFAGFFELCKSVSVSFSPKGKGYGQDSLCLRGPPLGN